MLRMVAGPGVNRQLLSLRVAVVLAWSSAVLLLVLDVVAGRPPLPAAGLVVVCSAVTVALAERLGIRVPAWTDRNKDRQYLLGAAGPAVVATLVRALPWPLLAWQLDEGSTRLPVTGDVFLLAQSLLLVVGILSDLPRRSSVRTLRLGFDSVLAGLGLTIVLWAVAIGPSTEYAASGRVLTALVLSFALLLQLVLVTLVIVREPVTHGVEAVVATALVVAAEVGVVVTAFQDGGRTVPGPLALGWVVGWVLMTRSVLRNRTLPDEVVSTEVAERREIRSTDLATGAVVVSVVVVMLISLVGSNGLPMPGGTIGAVVVLLGVTVFAARESLLGRLRARMTTQLRRQAQVDPLTGLANRRGLTERLRRISPDDEWSVLALDLDGFKAVNDIHGHAAGDDVLVIVADVLRALSPADGVAARTGGDEFAVLTRGDVTAARQLGVRIAAAVRDQLSALGLGPRITVSVGVGRVESGTVDGPESAAVQASVGHDRLTAVVEAAAALRAAKDLGRDRVQVYPGLVARQRERRLLIERRLREALRAGEVTTVAQPIVDLTSGATVAVEALARWKDDELGLVPPAEFVLVAERSGLVADLGRCVLRSAVEQYRAHGLVGSGVRLAVNVSPLELRGPGYVDGLAEVLVAGGVPGREVVVEVTEAVVIEAGDPALRVLSALNDLGVQVAIDDFGTGYSALGYLRRLPVQSMKVDRSLVAEALASVRTRQIVAGVVDLARRLGLLVTLEGIEDLATARLANELGADLGQGYLLGRPGPWAHVAERRRAPAPTTIDLRTVDLTAPEPRRSSPT